MSRVTTAAEHVLESDGLAREVSRRRTVLLFDSAWSLRCCVEENPDFQFSDSM